MKLELEASAGGSVRAEIARERFDDLGVREGDQVFVTIESNDLVAVPAETRQTSATSASRQTGAVVATR